MREGGSGPEDQRRNGEREGRTVVSHDRDLGRGRGGELPQHRHNNIKKHPAPTQRVHMARSYVSPCKISSLITPTKSKQHN